MVLCRPLIVTKQQIHLQLKTIYGEELSLRKVAHCALAATLVFSIGTLNLTQAEAKTADDVNGELNELDKKQADLNKKKEGIDADKDETQGKIDKNLDKQDSVQKQMDKIDAKLRNTQAKVEKKESEIATTNEQINMLKNKIADLKNKIDKLKKEIIALKKSIEKREAILKDRLRAVQTSGGNMKYIEVLLGSKSFSDFISRTSAVNTIMDQDKSIMDELEADKRKMQQKMQEVKAKKAQVEANKKKIEDKKSELENQKNSLQSLKNDLDGQMAKKNKLQKKLKKDHADLEEHKVSLEDQQEILRKQEASIAKARELANQEKERIAEEQRKAEERAAANKAQSNNGGDSGSSSTNSVTQQRTVAPNAAPKGGGTLSYPVNAPITSGYEARWGTFHYGIDFGVPVGTPIHAAASGVVFMTSTENDGRMNGYGNVVLVTHVIDGKTYTTLYAHLSSINVSEGQTVSRGQVIAHSGNTGESTGPHMHFEVHNGNWSYHGAVNPMPYLN